MSLFINEEQQQHTGFTGTQAGMTIEQKHGLHAILKTKTGWFHHGDCIGADAEADSIAKKCKLKTDIHPPTNPDKRAFCKGDKMRREKKYIPRNHDIVDAVSHLLATPYGMEEELRSGTWATIRYARKVKKALTIIFPNGKILNENM